jgi:hypothetical protein
MGGRVSAVRFWAVVGLFFSAFGWSQSAPIPSIVLSTSKSEIAAGKTARISWTSTNANRCVGSGSGWSQTYEGTAAARGTFTSAALNDRSNTFVLTCTGPGGTASQSLTILALPKPQVTLTANPDRALPGGAVTLGWQSTDATSCSASGAPFTGTKATSGTAILSDLTKGTKKFSLSCKGVGGTTKVTTQVAVVPAPTLTFSASKTQIPENTATQLKWKANDATTCIASGDWSGEQKTSGSFPTGNLTEDQTYTLSCEGPNGEVEQTVTVQVVGAPQVRLSVAQEVIAPGENVTISWDVQDAQSCKASGTPFTGDKNINGGSETLESLTKGNKTFKLTCKGGGGTTAAEAKLTVIAPPTLTFSASKTQIPESTTTQLRWKATDATTCLASGDWSGEQALTGSYTTPGLTTDKTYTLRCSGPTGEIDRVVAVKVLPAPMVSLRASKTTLFVGEDVELSWTVSFAQACTASGFQFTGSKEVKGGSLLIRDVTTGEKVFRLSCKGVGGTTTMQVVLPVIDGPQLTFSSPSTQLPTLNTGSTLTWASTNATRCIASGDWSGQQGTSGSFTTGPVVTDKTYILTCFGAEERSVSRRVDILVGDPQLNIDVLSIDFGRVGAYELIEKSFLLTNTSRFTIAFQSVELGTSQQGEEKQIFTLKNECGSTLPSQAQCKLTIIFAPNQNGFFYSNLKLKFVSPLQIRFPTYSTGLLREQELTFSGRGEFWSLAVSMSGNGRGKVVSDPTGIECTEKDDVDSIKCRRDFNAGDTVTLIAQPASDSAFDAWEGGCIGAAPKCEVRMDFIRRVTARFIRTLSSSLNVSVSDIPSSSKRVIALVDDGKGVSIRGEFAVDGSGRASGLIGLPVGENYRVRVIALGGTGTFPSVVAGGRVEGVVVAAQGNNTVEVALKAPRLTVDPSTPTTVQAGGTARIIFNIEDPADTQHWGGGSARLWWKESSFASNFLASPSAGSLERLEPGRYRYTINFPVPGAAGTIFYQFGESAYGFQNPNGQEAPFLVLPDLNGGGKLLELLVQLPTGSSRLYSALPAERGITIDTTARVISSNSLVINEVGTKNRVTSVAVDYLTGSIYRLAPATGEADGDLQRWSLDYLSVDGNLFGRAALPSTTPVAWRGNLFNSLLPTNGWVRVCSDRVWAVQDGYELFAHVANRDLSSLEPGRLTMESAATVTVVTDAQCAPGGAIELKGYTFGVSADEPLLRDEAVPATYFKLKLDPTGRESARKSETRAISVGEICALPRAQELEGFCRAADAALQANSRNPLGAPQ